MPDDLESLIRLRAHDIWQRDQTIEDRNLQNWSEAELQIHAELRNAPHQIAVLVPGILGSSITFRDGANVLHELWGSDIVANYRRVIQTPDVLRLDLQQRPTECSLLEEVNIGSWVPYRIRLWRRTINYLNSHQKFAGYPGRILKYGYDWRRSLLESAQQLATDLAAHRQRLAEIEHQSPTSYRFVFITHSMGGLLLRAAVGAGFLAPESIAQLVHIGTPFRGAPAALTTLYSGPDLPLLRQIHHIHRRKNATQFWKLFLNGLRSFPSVYQLLPPQGERYAWFSDLHLCDPLGGPPIDDVMRIEATRVHQAIQQGKQILVRSGVIPICIYGALHSNTPTHAELQVTLLGSPTPGYKVHSPPRRQTMEGDGTVPAYSAMENASPEPMIRVPRTNVDHAVMCDDPNVIAALSQYV